MRAAIFLNGEADPPGLLGRVASAADLVVAADGGALRALGAGVVPDLVVGDMDSLGEKGAREVAALGAALERHPAKKDAMDGHLAVLAARARGATEADLLCAAGGSFSAAHAVAHILLAAERAGLRTTLVARWGLAFVVENGGREVRGAPGDAVSVFPLSGVATGVDLIGFAYPLSGARMAAGETLGFHNELLAGGAGWVRVGEGALFVIQEREGRAG